MTIHITAGPPEMKEEFVFFQLEEGKTKHRCAIHRDGLSNPAGASDAEILADFEKLRPAIERAARVKFADGLPQGSGILHLSKLEISAAA